MSFSTSLQHPVMPVPMSRTPAAATGAARYRAAERRDAPRWASFSAIALAHVALFAGLMQIDSVREQVTAAAPIFVSFISAPEPVPARAVPPPPPRARPEVPKERPLVASTRPTPAPAAARAAPVAEAPVAPAPAPQASAAVAEPAVAAPAAPASVQPPPATPPRFTGAGLDNAAAEYPLMSRRLKETGRVTLRVLVTPGGTAERVELEKSSGFERLDDSARSAVRSWRFIPAHQGEQAVAQWVNVSIPFELTNS